MRSGGERVKLVQTLTRSASAIQYAKDLLARCESGEVIAITAIEEHPGGDYTIEGSATENRTATAGKLLQAAIMRLSN